MLNRSILFPLIRCRKKKEKTLYPLRWDRTWLVKIVGRPHLTLKYHYLVLKGKEMRGMISIKAILWNKEAPKEMRATLITIVTNMWIIRTHSPKLTAPCNWKEWIRSQAISRVTSWIAKLKDMTPVNIFMTSFSIRNTKTQCCKLSSK